MLELEIADLRVAFGKIQEGKEKELKDLNLTFFVKRKALVEKYN